VHECLLFCTGYALQYPFKHTGNLAEKQRLEVKFVTWNVILEPLISKGHTL